jgi:hypothetical protein
MRLWLRNMCRSSALLAALLCAATGNAMTIKGLSPFEPVAGSASITVGEQALQVCLSPERSLVISPWPGYLPQQFDRQNVRGERQLLPAGPSDLLAFTRRFESRPWLLVGANSRRGTTIAGTWHWQMAGEEWFVTDGNTEKKLKKDSRQGRSVTIDAGADRWRVYLLDASAGGARRSGISNEAEPRISWAAVRQIRRAR